MFGVVWSLGILKLNTGSEIDRNGDHGKWYADENSLSTTVLETFSLVIILVSIQFLIQLIWFREAGEDLQGFIGSKSSSDNYTKVKHISYEIEQ